eukprot:5719488-Pyramimonas_sp.AAC.2
MGCCGLIVVYYRLLSPAKPVAKRNSLAPGMNVRSSTSYGRPTTKVIKSGSLSVSRCLFRFVKFNTIDNG